MNAVERTIRDVVIANRILARHNVLAEKALPVAGKSYAAIFRTRSFLRRCSACQRSYWVC